MSNRKNSISESIKDTALNSPERFFFRNNGLTVICNSFELNKDSGVCKVVKGSIINGQQTVRCLHRNWGSLIKSASSLFLPVKVISFDTGSNRDELKEIARSSNRQNPIKASDLYSNESDQARLKEDAKYLPASLSFNYVAKRTIDQTGITKEEAILYLNTFIHLNPTDRTESLFVTHYSHIFRGAQAFEIAIIDKFAKNLDEACEIQDQNLAPNSFWQPKAYKKFKKKKTSNYLLYLLSLILSEKFNLPDVKDKQNLLKRIFSVMQATQNFNIKFYFNDDFWAVFQKTVYRFVKVLYEDQDITQDFMRKKIQAGSSTMHKYIEIYDNIIADSAAEGTRISPALDDSIK